MNGVEAAASLFGPEEPASDPFAALGTNADSPARPATDDLFQRHGASTAPDFLTPALDNSDSFGAPENSAAQAPQYHAQQKPRAQDYGYSPDPYATNLNAGGTGQDQVQGWYDEHGQWHHYEQVVQESHTLTAHDPPPPPASYSPYATPLTPSVSAYTPSTAKSTYDSYAPPVQPTNIYTPHSVVGAASSYAAYNPYAPATGPQTVASPPAPSYSAPVSGPHYSPYSAPTHTSYAAPVTSAVPPPPAPAPPITRPKVSNAYDPPFPTTKPSKRGAASRVASQTYSQYTYPTSPPPVPPTIGGSFAPSPYSQPAPPPPLRNLEHPVSSSGGNQWEYTAPSTTSGAGMSAANNNYSVSSHGATQVANLEAYPGVYGQETTSGQPLRDSFSEHGLDPEMLHHGSNETMYEDKPRPFDPTHSPDEVNPLSSPSSAGRVPIDERHPPYHSPPAIEAYSRTSSPLQTSPIGSPRKSKSSFSPPLPQHTSYARANPAPASENSARAASPQPFASPSQDGPRSLPQADYQGSYAPSLANAVERSSSPSFTYTNGTQSPLLSKNGISNAYLPKSAALGGERVASPALPSTDGHHTTPFDPYSPRINQYANGYAGQRVASPGALSVRSLNGPQSGVKQYTPTNVQPPKPDSLRNRSMSNGSVLSVTSTGHDDPYAPSQRRNQPSEIDYGNYSSRYNYPASVDSAPRTYTPAQTYDYPTQEVLTKPSQAPYAPSPSLLGANDPLGRTSARVPLVSFGFGGKLVTCFHGAASLSTGFDVALSSRNSTGIHIRFLKAIIPDSALDTSAASYPGPLFSDPETSVTSLVRTGHSAQIKSKKAKVVKYLTDRVDEITRGLGYLHVGGNDRRQAEGKLVLVKLLKVMVENDGRLSGTPQIDAATRIAFLPRLDGAALGGSSEGQNGLSSITDTQSSSTPYSTIPGPSESHESPISVTTLRSSALDKIQDFLVRGERRQAYHYALDERLWAHAMVIASSVDKEAWKEVVNEFLRSELGVKDDVARAPAYLRPNDTPLIFTNGREGLRVAYSLFSGQGPASVQELLPQNLLSQTTGRPQPSTVPLMTPVTPNFAAPSHLGNIPVETLAKWPETVAMMMSSPLTPEISAAMTALGDQLLSNQWLEAAHACYLLAPQTSLMGGIGNPAARIVLLGSRSPQVWPNFVKDPDPVIFSEIVEFAMSLATPPKGQDAFHGLAHLQAYRFIRAMELAEVGDIQLANRYCEAITATLTRSSPYFTTVLLEQLKGLSDRITGVSHADKSSSWIGAKLSKPSLDTIGGWLEGRFTKLVTGDTDSTTPPEEEVVKADERGFSGPFAHYSTISSATPSASPSPQPSVVNLNVLPPHRTGSALGPPSTHPAYGGIDRASSAMDYTRRKPSPGPRIASASAITTTFSQSHSFGQALSDYSPMNGYATDQDAPVRGTSADTNDDSDMDQEATWWGSSSYREGSSAQTPTATSFLRVDETAVPSSSDGFISLMDDTSYTVSSPARSTPQPSSVEDDDEDLGFGNSNKREKPKTGADEVKEPKSEAAKITPPAQALGTNTSGSWISRWWKKGDSATPGPVKASLGEESAFYYDKDLKRWVNKKAGADETPKPPAPPPPSRAQTASPGMTGLRPPSATGNGPPTGRSASAIDLSTSPPSKTIMRVRSNLVPMPESAPSTPTGTRLPPSGPPPGRPKSQASKRNIRTRYVDVFQQEGGGA